MATLWPASMVTYPEAQATHEEVLADKQLFQTTLDAVLQHLGIKLKVPKVGGVEVDLHLLYKEVTALGGVDLVISRKQWVIVCEPFSFPTSFTNKSFVIKKLYISTLYHYEQLYFHRRRSPPQQSLPNAGEMVSSDSRFPKRKAEYQSESGPITIVPGHSSSSGSPSAPSGLEAGTRFTGVIDSRFDQGYMITLSLPSQKLKGILYKQAQPHLKLPGAPRHGREDTTVSQELESGLDMGKRMRTAGPTLPRPARTPFQFFQLGVNKEQLMQLHPDPTSANAKDALPKLMSDLWHQMTPDQRQPFLDMGDKDRARYDKEWQDYCNRAQGGSPGTAGEETQEGRLAGLGGAGLSSAGTPSTSAGPSNMATPGAPRRMPYPRQIRIGVPLKPRGVPLLPSHLGMPSMPPPSMHPHHAHLMGDPMGHPHHYHPHPHHLTSHRTASMPPPRAGPSMDAPPYDPRPAPSRIASAPGFHLLPPDMEPEDLEHLCYYPGAEEDHHHHHHPPAFHMDHHAGMLDPHAMHDDHLMPMPEHRNAHGNPADGAGLHTALAHPSSGLDHHHHHHGPGDTFAMPMDTMHGHEHAAGARSDIDLFGCSTTIQVTSGASPAIKHEANGATLVTGGPPQLPKPLVPSHGTAPDHRTQGGAPMRSASGQDIASTAGSPSDQPASHSFHGAQGYAILPPRAKYGGMYDGGAVGPGHYDHHQVRELLDHDVHTLPHMFD